MKRPQSTPQIALEVRCALRVVPDQSRGLGLCPSIKQSLTTGCLWGRSVTLNEAPSFSQGQFLERDVAVSLQQPQSLSWWWMRSWRGCLGGTSQHPLQPTLTSLRSTCFHIASNTASGNSISRILAGTFLGETYKRKVSRMKDSPCSWSCSWGYNWYSSWLLLYHLF